MYTEQQLQIRKTVALIITCFQKTYFSMSCLIMKNKLMAFSDRLLLRKRAVIESVNDFLKNICQIEHSRCCSIDNFLLLFWLLQWLILLYPKSPLLTFLNSLSLFNFHRTHVAQYLKFCSSCFIILKLCYNSVRNVNKSPRNLMFSGDLFIRLYRRILHRHQVYLLLFMSQLKAGCNM